MPNTRRMMMAAAGASGGEATLDGTLWSWGVGTHGQLGHSNTTSLSSPVQIGSASDWAILTNSSRRGNGVIKSDGTLWVWGQNSYGGILGTSNTTGYSSPVKVGARTDWVSSANAAYHSLNVTSAGKLYSNGNNYAKGALGHNNNTTHNSPVQVGSLTDWAMVAAEQYSSAAVKSDGTLWTWGESAAGEGGRGNTTSISSPVKVGAETNWAAVYMKRVGDIGARKTDGTLWSWGEGSFGQHGNSATSDVSSPVQVGSDSDWLKMAVGKDFKIGIKTDYSMWSWGLNNNGQLGDNSETNRSSPVRIGASTDWFNVAANAENTVVAVAKNGTLWSWGRASDGCLGNGNTSTNLSIPVQVGSDSDWYDVSAGQAHIIALK